ncbi:MAG: hypothetical protein KIT14_04050 [bacterium]|nr:hypothetical protein [bacterium]
MRALLLGLCVAIGLGLRLWSANTTLAHGDEYHYVGDAGWSVVAVPGDWRWDFVRSHAVEHRYIDWKRSVLWPWANERTARAGHPFLFPLVTGTVFALAPPATPDVALHRGRVVNAVADASTILLLPLLTGGLGAPPAAGLVAAALYAIFPPAATYAGLALLEPMAAPLVVLAMALLLRRRDRVGPAVGAGVATGLLVNTETWNVALLPAIGAVLLLERPRRVRDAGAWLVGAAATFLAVTTPTAWTAAATSDAFRVLRWDVAATLRHNLGFLADTQGYYFLGFAKHGFPPARALASVHGVLTPGMLALFAVSTLATVLRRRGRELVVLYLPVLLLLALTPPSDGIFRLYAAFPLACAAMGTALAGLGALGRTALLVPATAVGLLPILPDRLNDIGQVNLANMLLVNPSVKAPYNFYTATNPLRINLAPGMEITRRLWLPPGRYDVRVLVDGWPEVKLDDHEIIAADVTFGPRKRGDTVDLDGWIHTLRLSSPVAVSKYGAVVIRPTPPENDASSPTTTAPPTNAPSSD